MMESIREKWALFVIALGAIYGAWAFFTQPALHDLHSAETELSEMTHEREALVDHPESPVNVSSAAPGIESVVGLRFGAQDLLGEQTLLNTIAAESGVQIERIDPSGRSESTSFGPIVLYASSLKLEASGGYSEVARFLSVLANTPACVIEDVTFGVGGSGDVIEFSLELDTVGVVRRNRAIADGDDQ